MDSRSIPALDRLEEENFTGLVGTPEGRLIVAILLQAIDDLDFEIKNRYPLDTLPWFYSDNRVLTLACGLLEWDQRSLIKRIEERVENDRQIMLKEIKEKKNGSKTKSKLRTSGEPSVRALKGTIRDIIKKRAPRV
jgi:hypothetical protein